MQHGRTMALRELLKRREVENLKLKKKNRTQRHEKNLRAVECILSLGSVVKSRGRSEDLSSRLMLPMNRHRSHSRQKIKVQIKRLEKYKLDHKCCTVGIASPYKT